MLRKVVVFLGVCFLSACATDVSVVSNAEYLCGTQLVSAEYLSDNGVIINVGGNQMYLNGCTGGCGKVYQDITGNTQFWRKGNQAYLKIGTLTYPVCKDLFR